MRGAARCWGRSSTGSSTPASSCCPILGFYPRPIPALSKPATPSGTSSIATALLCAIRRRMILACRKRRFWCASSGISTRWPPSTARMRRVGSLSTCWRAAIASACSPKTSIPSQACCGGTSHKPIPWPASSIRRGSCRAAGNRRGRSLERAAPLKFESSQHDSQDCAVTLRKKPGNLCRSRALAPTRVVKGVMLAERPDQARMSRIVLVSNRVTDIRKAPQAGGVAVALADIVRTRPALWFGWNGEIAPEHATPTLEREGRIATVPLSEADHQAYYLGYSNSVLWPVFHNRLDLAQFEAGFFERYVGVNRRLAEQLRPLLRPDDLIWVHDYHLLPFATELRRLGAQNPIGYFLHIPFPPWQTFMAIPEHQQLARALAAYDLIGLQTKADVANLVTYLENGVYGRIVPDGRIRLLDRLLTVGSFPIGIDVADFAHAKRDSGLVQARAPVHRIIGVDRLDYTKGLPQKFKAFGQFLETNPRYRGQVVLTQIAPPTRGSVEAYTDIRQQLESLAGSINGRFGELDWVPIHYIHRSTARRRLADIYRSSRIGLVTPLRDGMNLVAKEYVAAQDGADPGVLILSQFAGAAEEMSQALIVNPYNIAETADVIRMAFEMDLSERQKRHAALIATVEKNNVVAWCRSFIAQLERVRSNDPAGWRAPEPIRSALAKLQAT